MACATGRQQHVEFCHCADRICRPACQTLYDGCGVGCATFETGWRGLGIDGAACASLALPVATAPLVMISHDGVDQREVEDVLRRRWPDVVVKSLEQEEPPWR